MECGNGGVNYVTKTVIAPHECTELKYAGTLKYLLKYLVRSSYLPLISPTFFLVFFRGKSKWSVIKSTPGSIDYLLSMQDIVSTATTMH